MAWKKDELRTVYHAPIREQSAGGYLLGLISRTLLAALGSTAFLLVFLDAFRLTALEAGGTSLVSSWTVILTALLVSILMTLSSLNRKTYHSVPWGALLLVALFVLLVYSPAAIPASFVKLWNTAFGNLHSVSVSYGYISSWQIPLFTDIGVTLEKLLTIGTVFVTFLTTMALSRCILYGVRLCPTLLLTCLYVFPVFLLNIAKTNYGVALLFAFIIGVAVLWIGDRRFLGYMETARKKKEAKLRRRLEKKELKEAEKRKKKADKRRLAVAYYAAKDAGLSDRKARKAMRAEKKAMRLEAHPEKKKDKKQKQTKLEKKQLRLDAKKAAAEVKALRREEKRKQKLEKKEKTEKERLYRRHLVSCTGYAGSLAALIAFLIGLFVAFQVTENFPIIPEIYDPASVVSEEVTAIITGGDIDLNELAKHIEVPDLHDRHLSLEPMDLSSERFLTIYSSTTLPIYLRQWVSGVYDLSNDTWKGASTDTVDAYRERFGQSFTPDVLRSNFYKLTYPSALQQKNYGEGRTFLESGFAAAYIAVERTKKSDYLLFTPAYMYQTFTKGDSLEAIPRKASHYFDGIYSSRNFRKKGIFGTYSFLTNMRFSDNVGQAMTLDEGAYEALYDCVIAYEALKASLEDDRMKVGRSQRLERLGSIVTIYRDEETGKLDYTPFMEACLTYMQGKGLNRKAYYLLDDYIKNWTAQQKADYFDQVMLEMDYRSYVHEDVSHFTETTGSEEVRKLAAKIIASYGLKLTYETKEIPLYPNASKIRDNVVLHSYTPETLTINEPVLKDINGAVYSRYDLVMTVINYLSDYYEYEVIPHPNKYELNHDSVLEQFLFDMKEGYCIHFASAACMLLREFGLPVRYAEGALVTSFYKNATDVTTLRYKTYVAPKNLHAWIEVYFNGLGWVQFECTPEYYLKMYPERNKTIIPVTPEETTEIEETEPLETDEDDDEEPDDEQPGIPTELIVGCAVLLVLVLSATFTVLTLRKRASRMLTKRREMIAAAKDATLYESEGYDSRALTRRLTDELMKILVAIGCAPAQGELASDYGRRMEETFGNLSAVSPCLVMEAIEKEEFGHGASYEELNALADYLADVTKNAYNALTRKERIKIRYFKNIL